jgi:hypothetical protein
MIGAGCKQADSYPHRMQSPPTRNDNNQRTTPRDRYSGQQQDRIDHQRGARPTARAAC